MPGHPRLGPQKKNVDARHKAGHDELEIPALSLSYAAACSRGW
jgi:hypothetical protein